MEILHQRRPSVGEATISEVSVDGKFECYVLEDVIRAPGVKVYGQTAIPPGRRRVTMELMPRVGRKLPYIHDVKGYTGIFIHAGNKPIDTLGCLLTGRTVAKDQQAVFESVVALKYLVQKIEAALARGEEVWIDTRNPEGMDEPAAEPTVDLQAAVLQSLVTDPILLDAIEQAIVVDPISEPDPTVLAAVQDVIPEVLPTVAQDTPTLLIAKSKRGRRSAQAKPEAG